jgi:ribosome-binding protein aMBF1 (putative translation factor)
MNEKTREILEGEGYKVYEHAGDAVGMNEYEKQLMELRIRLAISIRKRREKLNLTQADLAQRLKTTPPRVAQIERAARSISFDRILTAYAAVGGRIRLLELAADIDHDVKKVKKAKSKQAR